MIDISNKSTLKYLLFGSLYITEGIQISLGWVLTPIYLLQQQYSPEIVTLSSGIIMIPWVIKFIFGYYVDRFSHHGRKKIITLGGIFSAASIMIAAIINPSISLFGFIGFMFLGHCSISFLDISLDAWAIDITTKKERGKLSGSMTIGLYVGMIIGTAVLGSIAESMNFISAFLFGGLIIFLISLIPLIIKEEKRKKQPEKIINNVLQEIKKKKIILYLIFLSIVSLNSGIISLIAPLFMDIKLQLDVAMIGYISAVFSLTRAIGSFVFGALSDKIGRIRIILINLMITIIFSTLLITVQSSEAFLIIYAAIGFLTGGLFSSVFALSMDKTNQKIAATQFGIFMAALNLGELTGGSISGSLYALFSFTQVFLYSAWVIGPAILLFYIINKRNLKNL